MKYLKKMLSGYFMAFILYLFAFQTAWAQGDSKDQVNSVKVGYFTQELGLNTQEAEKFWPVYFEYQDKKAALRRSGSGPIEIQEQELKLSKEYDQMFRTILPSAKVDKLYEAEKAFRQKLIDEVKDRKSQGRD
ncbi:MAG: hypothetical protein R2798_08270 [Chitinophagales bacterium]|nr:hypothetical protein [Bacteroidota bacterium]MCB9042428.1 hypothetical protein [Chitinophagales bacterium]